MHCLCTAEGRGHINYETATESTFPPFPFLLTSVMRWRELSADKLSCLQNKTVQLRHERFGLNDLLNVILQMEKRKCTKLGLDFCENEI